MPWSYNLADRKAQNLRTAHIPHTEVCLILNSGKCAQTHKGLENSHSSGFSESCITRAVCAINCHNSIRDLVFCLPLFCATSYSQQTLTQYEMQSITEYDSTIDIYITNEILLL